MTMFNTGKCPSCKTRIASVKIESIKLTEEPSHTVNGMAYMCPSCSTILSISVDPISSQMDVVNEIVRREAKSVKSVTAFELLASILSRTLALPIICINPLALVRARAIRIMTPSSALRPLRYRSNDASEVQPAASMISLSRN